MFYCIFKTTFAAHLSKMAKDLISCATTILEKALNFKKNEKNISTFKKKESEQARISFKNEDKEWS